MSENTYDPVAHDQQEFLKKARKRRGFSEAYDALEEEYQLARELLRARVSAGLTQEEVAVSMGTTKSAISRLEAAGKHSPSVATLKKYAHALGCVVEIRLVPDPRQKRTSGTRRRKRLHSPTSSAHRG
jgi:DNA-binding XRE family transcriptional regulator